MRRVRYQVACSLDGFIAAPGDGFDWITPEPSFDFDELYAQFDTLLIGRRTYEIVSANGENFSGKQVVVASRTLRAEDHPGIEVVDQGLEARIRELREQPGRVTGAALLTHERSRAAEGDHLGSAQPIEMADLGSAQSRRVVQRFRCQARRCHVFPTGASSPKSVAARMSGGAASTPLQRRCAASPWR
jgi:dihydrofolate reductase